MSRIGEWIRNDLRGVNKPGEIFRTVRTFPIILLRALLIFVFGLFVIYAVLAIFGHADAFGEWWWLAALWAGSRAGSMVSRLKASAPRMPSDDR
jgi:hypothetical protein